MRNWLSRQNGFTRWAAIGTAASAATGMAAVAVLVMAFIAVFLVGQRTIFGRIVYPPVLDEIAKAALYGIGLSIVGFLIGAVGLVVALFVGTNTGQGQTEE